MYVFIFWSIEFNTNPQQICDRIIYGLDNRVQMPTHFIRNKQMNGSKRFFFACSRGPNRLFIGRGKKVENRRNAFLREKTGAFSQNVKGAPHLHENEIELGAGSDELVEPARRHDALAVVQAVLQDDQELFQVPETRELVDGEVLEHRHRAGHAVIGVRARALGPVAAAAAAPFCPGGKVADHGDVVTSVHERVRDGAEHVEMAFAAERENRQHVVAGRETGDRDQDDSDRGDRHSTHRDRSTGSDRFGK